MKHLMTSVNRYDNTPSFDTTSFSYVRGDQYTNSLTPYVNVRWLLFDGLSVTMNKQKLALLEQERLRVLNEVKDLSGDRYAYEMMRKELGNSVTFDVLQAKNSFLSDSTNYLLQELNVKNSRLRLNLLLGEPPSVQFTLVDSFRVELQEYAIYDLIDSQTELLRLTGGIIVLYFP
ncbi:MAG: hypothetical protein ABIJ04_03280 [Bacteroidota bacterium]